MTPAPEPSWNEDRTGPPRPPPPRTWRDRIEQAADATGTTPARLLLGAGCVLVAVVIGLWLTRPPADPVEVSLPYASTTVALPPETTTSTAGSLVVHVAGAVAAPGVYELPPGSRVDDGIVVAGGLAPGADGTRLNLAAPVADGERVYVPVVGEDPPPVAGGGPGSAAAGSGTGAAAGPVDLNQADAAALEALPGVGPATARAILEHRDRIGAFSSVDQLLDVRGIGEAKLEGLRDLVTV